MKIFSLPDLGEGLPDAEVHEWHVQVGDQVLTDQPLVAMETAKAIVDVPSPYTGTVAKLCGQVGDIIRTGAPLVEFIADTGTVVGTIEVSEQTIDEATPIQSKNAPSFTSVKVTPAVRALAKKLQVDLTQITPTGQHGILTATDVKNALGSTTQEDQHYQPLSGARRSMALNMAKAHQAIVPVTLFDEVDISTWHLKDDITTRLIQAIIAASQQEKTLNAWFNEAQLALRPHEAVHLGLAIDNEQGLFVPVIHDAQQYSADELRKQVNTLKADANDRRLSPKALQGATITLSNFGKFAGRFANPIVIPPTVAIIGAGKVFKAVVAKENQPVIHPVLPLSLTFDHRAVTGGEAARFMHVLLHNLSK